MKKVIVSVFSTGLLGSAIALSGCSQPEDPKTVAPPPPAAAPAATPAPVVAPKPTSAEHLTMAKESLTKAQGELKEKNYQGTQDLLAATKAHLMDAATDALPPVKAGIDKAVATLAGIKDIKAPGTDKTLGSVITSITSLSEMAGKTSAMAAGAAGGMMGKAAGAPKEAAGKATPKKP